MLSLPATGITRMLVTRGEESLWLGTTEVLQIYPRQAGKNDESGAKLLTRSGIPLKRQVRHFLPPRGAGAPAVYGS
ncbi:MAG: hypothetical protein QOE55_8395 [Acidobacteriaceae bacterium]|nr:hypothetical protein [Acidobacteriaceae bacterium]